MTPNLPKDIFKLAIELIKHQAKKQLGDDFIDVLAKQIVDYAGENAFEKVNEWLESGENAEKLLEAFQDADKDFYKQGDDVCKQMIVSKPLSKLSSLEKLAKSLPKTLDDDGLLEAIRLQFETDWPNLSVDVHMGAAHAYRVHLERSLAARCNQMLPSIFTKVERIETNTEKMLKGLDKIFDKIDKFTVAKDLLQPSFIIPFPRNEKFVGREGDLKHLHVTLMGGETVGVRPAMLSGMGGIGKTQLAVEYVYRFKGSYPGGIYWVNAAQNWIIEFAHLAEAIGLRSDEENENRRNMQLAIAFFRYVNETPDTLVVFDNIEDPSQLKQPIGKFIPSELPRVLFTTRRRDPDLSFQAIDMHLLPEDVALKLLLNSKVRQPLLEKEDSDPEKNAARSICKDLGGLPLALALASAYLGKYPSVTMEGYRQRLKNEGLRAVDKSGADSLALPTRHADAVAATLKSQWDALEDHTAKKIVFTASILSEASHIPYARLRLFLNLPDEIMPGYPDPFEEALNALQNLWLVEELTNYSLRLHPLVRDFALQTLSDFDAFAHQTSINMLASLENIPRLVHEVNRRGVDALLTDVRIGLALYHTNKSLDELERILDNEAHNLRRWISSERPAFLSQQLYNRAFTRNSQKWQNLLRRELDSKKLPWMEEKHPYNSSHALLRVFEEHSIRHFFAVAITLDGQQVIASANNSSMRLLDIENGLQLKIFNGHRNMVWSIKVTSDGQRVVSASEDGTLRLWDIQSGKQLQVFEGHSDNVWHVEITPDGRQLVSASWDKTLRLWDIQSGQQLKVFKGHTDKIFGVAVTPDGRQLVSGSSDQTLRLWDIQTGQQLQVFKGTGAISDLRVTPDGQRVVSSSFDNTLRLWDLKSGRNLQVFEGHLKAVNRLAITPDGQRVVSASNDHTLRLWDIQSGKQLQVFEGHSDYVNDVAITPNGRQIVSASFDKTLRLWDIQESKHFRAIQKHLYAVNRVAITPDGKYAVSTSEDKTLRLWDIQSGQQVRVFEGHTRGVWDLALTANGTQAVSTSQDHTLRLWNLRSGKLLRVFKGHTFSVHRVAITSNGKYIISASKDRTLRLWDLKGEQLRVFKIPNDQISENVAISPDGALAIFTTEKKTLRLWDIKNDKQLLIFKDSYLNEDHIMGLFTDGIHVVTLDRDTGTTMHLWNLYTGKQLCTFNGHTDVLTYITVTSDQAHIISTSLDGTLRVWNIHSGNSQILLSSDVPFTCVAISPDGKIIIAGDSVGMIHFIEVQNLELSSSPPSKKWRWW